MSLATDSFIFASFSARSSSVSPIFFYSAATNEALGYANLIYLSVNTPDALLMLYLRRFPFSSDNYSVWPKLVRNELRFGVANSDIRLVLKFFFSDPFSLLNKFSIFFIFFGVWTRTVFPLFTFGLLIVSFLEISFSLTTNGLLI